MKEKPRYFYNSYTKNLWMFDGKIFFVQIDGQWIRTLCSSIEEFSDKICQGDPIKEISASELALLL
jgi:hypothetical protein